MANRKNTPPALTPQPPLPIIGEGENIFAPLSYYWDLFFFFGPFLRDDVTLMRVYHKKINNKLGGRRLDSLFIVVHTLL